MDSKVLEIRHLQVLFERENKTTEAVGDVSLEVNSGEIMGIVGESGSGKSTLCLAVMRLLAASSAKITQGEILFQGKDILKMTERELVQHRGKDIGMIFQEPMSSLNPLVTVGKQIANVLRLHQPQMDRAAQKKKTIELLRLAGIPSPEIRVRDYPHSLSGGMRQRVMIAMALANDPALLLCDEPTTALDVTIQAQVLQLIRGLCRQKKSAALFVTHDMGVIAQVADRVAVMYGGKIVECAEVKEIFENPKHPYTAGLLASIPSRNQGARRLYCIPGTAAGREAGAKGCPFAPRCKNAQSCCFEENPPRRQENGHMTCCSSPLDIQKERSGGQDEPESNFRG